MRSKTTLQTPSLHRIVEIINTSPTPLTIENLIERMQFSRPYVRNLLWFARGSGLVDGVREGKDWLWASPEIAARIRPTAAAARARRTERERQLRKARDAERKRQIEDADESSIQRILPASAPLPFKCTAPASVFHLGGML